MDYGKDISIRAKKSGPKSTLNKFVHYSIYDTFVTISIPLVIAFSLAGIKWW